MLTSERFLKYVSFDTESDPASSTVPTTMKQKDLGAYLVKEMKALGIKDAFMDDLGYVYGTIPASEGYEDKTVLGLIAHMDTSCAASGKDIKAKIVHYEGGDILLNEEKNIVMSPSDFPNMNKYVGQDLIVTDGTTLLGGDDKAGIAEIISAAEYFLTHPEVKHGAIKIGFTPDEEVGRGANHFDVKGFGADLAYTVDGGELGEISYENFNAASAVVTIHGRSVHPGSAKNIMISALDIAMELRSMLPAHEHPAYTEDREGFTHLDNMKGDIETCVMDFIIRDHDKEKFEAKKARMEKIVAYLNEKYSPACSIELNLKDSYYNMLEQIKPHMELIDKAYAAFRAHGVEPMSLPVRGGTDGARLSYMGLPCPNLCTGGHNCHGRFEYVCIQSMDKIVDILVTLVQSFAE
ncbi:MAG: peptidase T [Oscillospiraceae bacterium]|nr:peptidase T [Oscillospiraceae bacterium]